MGDFSSHLHIQDIALQVLRDIQPFITVGKTESRIAVECRRLLEELGVSESWYYGLFAMVLVGERTTLSLSGRDYRPAGITVEDNDLVTIDLSPLLNGCWGDCARSYVIESGRVVTLDQNPTLAHGIHAEKDLHARMMRLATPDMTMDQLYRKMNAEIEQRGYTNLDYRGNLGHSIEEHQDQRRYIEANSQIPLGDCSFFTFEPHIRRGSEPWGFKMENIYYFSEGQALPLGSSHLLSAVH